MTTHTVTLHVPETLYQQLQEHARQMHCSVEDVAVDVLVAAVPVVDDLPHGLATALSPLRVLDDTMLWRAARMHFAPEDAVQLEALHRKRQREGLTTAETQTMTLLVQHYDRMMLVRAQAAALLKQRGHDVASLMQCT